MSDNSDPTTQEVVLVVCGLLGAGVAAAGFFIMLGLGMSGGWTPDSLAMRELGQGIGRGIAQAACIEQRAEWRYDRCHFDE